MIIKILCKLKYISVFALCTVSGSLIMYIPHTHTLTRERERERDVAV